MLLKVREVASQLQISAATVYALAARGDLETVHIGRALRVEPDALRAFILSHSRPQSMASLVAQRDRGADPA